MATKPRVYPIIRFTSSPAGVGDLRCLDIMAEGRGTNIASGEKEREGRVRGGAKSEKQGRERGGGGRGGGG